MSERTDCSHKNLDKLAQQLLNLHLSYDKEMSQAATVLSSSGEYGVLYCLNQHCSCYSAGELAETLGLSSGRIANVLTTLEWKNLITRKRDHLDGRKTMVSLTEEGKQCVCKMFDEAEQFYKALIEKLGEDNTTEYIRLTELLLKAYKEIAEETPAPPDSAFAKMVESQQTLK